MKKKENKVWILREESSLEIQLWVFDHRPSGSEIYEKTEFYSNIDETYSSEDIAEVKELCEELNRDNEFISIGDFCYVLEETEVLGKNKKNKKK